jgi:transaldolase
VCTNLYGAEPPPSNDASPFQETFIAAGGDPSTVHSVASLFVSRVDSEIDPRLETLGGADARGLRGRAGVAQAKLAYRLFRDRFAGARWDRLRALGANHQRPMWASTSTKNPAYPDTMYVDSLIGPDTVTTLPEDTIDRFEDHGTLERTVDVDVDEADETMQRLDVLGVDMDAVGLALERQGVAAFHASFQQVLGDLAAKVERGARPTVSRARP